VAAAALEGGARVVQLREKSLCDRALWELAREMRRLSRRHGAVLIVNDRVDVALAVEADGVHLGQEDMPAPAARRIMGPEAIIGVSVGSVQEACAAEREGASYVSLGSIFPTGSKTDAGKAVGVGAIAELKHAVGLPVLAIGGINCDNVEAVIRAGADGAAVISAVAEAEDMVEATRELLRRIRGARGRGDEREQVHDSA
jgi:thiamine-phosphate pyrophosphorylase